MGDVGNVMVVSLLVVGDAYGRQETVTLVSELVVGDGRDGETVKLEVSGRWVVVPRCWCFSR